MNSFDKYDPCDGPSYEDETRQRDPDGGLRMVTKTIPPWWDRTEPNHPEHTQPKKGGRPKKKVIEIEKPLENKTGLAENFQAQKTRTNAIIITCPKCGKVWQTKWPHPPTTEDLRTERDRIIALHAQRPQECQPKTGGRPANRRRKK